MYPVSIEGVKSLESLGKELAQRNVVAKSSFFLGFHEEITRQFDSDLEKGHFRLAFHGHFASLLTAEILNTLQGPGVIEIEESWHKRGVAAASLRFDAMIVTLRAFSYEYNLKSVVKSGRKSLLQTSDEQVSVWLMQTKIEKLLEHLEHMLRISEKHMKDEIKRQPLLIILLASKKQKARTLVY